MKLSTIAATAALASCALAQTEMDPAEYAAGLLQTLQDAGLTSLLGVATQNVGSILPLLMAGNITVFAPTDEAFAEVNETVLNDQSLLLNIVKYHVYNGTYRVEDLSTESLTVAESSLDDPALVNLPGGKPQVAVLAATEGQVTIVQALQNVTTAENAEFENLLIYTIPSLLTMHTTVSETASAAGLTALVDALTQNALEIVQALDNTTGVTVFAPLNSAFENAASAISELNQDQISTVLANHVVNGTVVYSSDITGDTEATTASGQPLTFITNSTGIFVQSADITARVVRSDIIVKNGVVHLIDNVLANTASDPAAASSAAASASSAAATQTSTSMETAAPTQVLAPTVPQEASAAGGASIGVVLMGTMGLLGVAALVV